MTPQQAAVSVVKVERKRSNLFDGEQRGAYHVSFSIMYNVKIFHFLPSILLVFSQILCLNLRLCL